MNTDRESVERVAATILELVERDRSMNAIWTKPGIALHAHAIENAASMLRALLAERYEARALAKRWRDLYEWDYDGPLPTYHFPWEKKP